MLVCDYENCSDFTDDPEITSGGVHAEYSTVYHDECYKQKLFAEYVEDFVAQEKCIKVRVLVEKEVTLDYGWLAYDQWVDPDRDLSARHVDESYIERKVLEMARDFVSRGWAHEKGDDNGMFWEHDSSAKCEYAGRSRVGTLSQYNVKEAEIV